MTSYQTLKVDKDNNGVLTLTLNQAEKRNALSARMIEELTGFAAAMADDDARVVVLKGAGKTFCAGGDLNWMKAQIKANRATRMREARKLAMMLYALNTMPKPLIGLVHGGAFGGGVGMMAVCDMVIADQKAQFGLTETRLGLIPATISPYVMARIGEGMARRIFMSSRIFNAQEALQLGLVSTIADFEQGAENTPLEEEIKAYLNVAPKAVASAKRLARFMGTPINEEIIDHSINELADIWQSAEAMEGIEAFLNKSTPSWKKRN